jgi:hypothetical protein
MVRGARRKRTGRWAGPGLPVRAGSTATKLGPGSTGASSPAARNTAAIVWACMLGALLRGDRIMTLCPIAIVAGCKKCPAFSVCPLKTVIGDMPKAEDAKTAAPNKKK